jgi:hypothetical protein
MIYVGLDPWQKSLSSYPNCEEHGIRVSQLSSSYSNIVLSVCGPWALISVAPLIDHHAALLQANQIAPAPVPAPETRLPSATVVDREVEATAESTEIVVKEEEQTHELGHEDTQVS